MQRTLIANSGSADEVRACLKVAIGWGYLTDEVVTEPMALVDRELRLLWGLMNKRA